jgi:hypothetical protein
MTASVVYRMLRRIAELLVLRRRSDDGKAVQILVLRHELTVAPSTGRSAALHAGRPGRAQRARPRVSSRSLGECVRPAGNDPPRAPRPDRATLDVAARADRAASDRCPARDLELRLACENYRPSAAPRVSELALVPARAGFRDHRVRPSRVSTPCCSAACYALAFIEPLA